MFSTGTKERKEYSTGMHIWERGNGDKHLYVTGLQVNHWSSSEYVYKLLKKNQNKTKTLKTKIKVENYVEKKKTYIKL